MQQLNVGLKIVGRLLFSLHEPNKSLIINCDLTLSKTPSSPIAELQRQPDR